jgi:hypothetical protein
MKECKIIWQLDWDSGCSCYWSWWVQGPHKEHRQQWLRPATSGSWKVWSSGSKPYRICWVDEYKCWSWKTNLCCWVLPIIFIVCNNNYDYKEIRNKANKRIVRGDNNFLNLTDTRIVLWSSGFWETIYL